MIPALITPLASAYTPGDEAAVFGHTFAEEYWTNSSLFVENEDGNATLTASYVGVDDFSAFLIAFNEIYTENDDRLVIPYQLFGMHFITPDDKEVFIGAIFAFLMVHNESYGNNDLPDVGNEDAWYIVPVTNQSFWLDVETGVEPIPATKVADNHYRFGMRYTNLTARVISTTGLGFLITLGLPILTVLISELVVEYDIIIDESGQVHAETLYTIGQVTRARWLGLFEADPSDLIIESMKVTAVHYLSIFTSNYNVTSSGTGTTIANPAATTPVADNITIKVGNDNERAFDIGFGRTYALINETTSAIVSPAETALIGLLAARAADFLLILWQAPLSIFLFAHMAYGLSTQLQDTYASVTAMVSDVGNAFDNTNWWYAVSFPEWNGLRIEQDPVYTAHTNLAEITTSPPPSDGDGGGLGGLFLIGGIAVVVIVLLLRRRR